MEAKIGDLGAKAGGGTMEARWTYSICKASLCMGGGGGAVIFSKNLCWRTKRSQGGSPLGVKREREERALLYENEGARTSRLSITEKQLTGGPKSSNRISDIYENLEVFLKGKLLSLFYPDKGFSEGKKDQLLRGDLPRGDVADGMLLRGDLNSEDTLL